MRPESNAYSRRWFELFHIGIGEARTIQEAAFVCHCAHLPDFRKLADVCCGMGRHARALSNQGYSVIGIDRDADAVAKARELAGGPSYVHADIRDYRPEPARSTWRLSCLRALVISIRQQIAMCLAGWRRAYGKAVV